MTHKEILDFVVAVGPTLVALAVVYVSARQSQWQRDNSERQLLIAATQLKLDLRAERVAVLSTVQGVRARLSYQTAAREGRNDQLFACLLEGQTLFDDDISDRLQAAWMKQVEYQNATFDYAAAVKSPSADTDAAMSRAEAIREELVVAVGNLHQDMILATRVDRTV